MNWKRVGRLLVCLVLVAALLVQVSPIQAKAAGNNFFYIDPELQLVSDLIGLGISVGTDAAAHNQVIQDAADWLAETGEWLSEGMLKVYKVAAAAGGFRYMVDGNFLQELFEWMFNAEVVTDSTDKFELSYPIVSNGSFVENGNTVFVFKSNGNVYATSIHDAGFYVCRYHGCASSSNPSYMQYYFVALSSVQGVSWRQNNGSRHTMNTKIIIGDDTFYYYLMQTTEQYEVNSFGSALVTSGDQLISDLTTEECIRGAFTGAFPATPVVTTDKDLTLNKVGAFGSILPDVYTEWFQNSTTITDTETGEEKTVVPIGLGQSVEETQGMTQEDIWAGTSSYIDTGTDDPGTDNTEGPEDNTGDNTGAGIVTGSLLERLFGNVIDKFDTTIHTIQEIPELLKEFMLDVKTGFLELPGKFAEWFNNIQTLLEQFLSGQIKLVDLLDGLFKPVKDAVLEALTTVFVPSEDYLTIKVDALRAKFPFVDSVISTGEFIRDSVSGDSGPPVIYVDLGRASSGSYGSQKVLLTDFAWYAEYKPTVDAVLSAALWAFFGWRVFLKLPGIISGESGYIGEVTAHREKMEKIRSGPPRKG